jgi:NDMA-dependent alcohol dehydrogenase
VLRRTRAAILTGIGRDWEVVDLELADPGPSEVLVRMEVAGLCHSDKHMQFGFGPYPFVGGHEGAGIVEAIGSAVTRVEVGDRVGASWIPSCGNCRWCITGQGNLCDVGANMATGQLVAGGYRFALNGEPIASMAGTATFSQWSVLDERSTIKVEPSHSFESISLVTCGVATGWGSVVNAGEVRAGDAVVIYGSGGIGMNAVRAAVDSHAGLVAVVEPIDWKRDFAKGIGADVVCATAEEAHQVVWEVTRGVGVDVAVVTVGVVTSDIVRAAFELTRKGGTIVLTGVADDMFEETIQLSGSMLTVFQKRIVGSLYGHCAPANDIPRLLKMSADGKLKIDDLVTERYSLDDINEGFADMLAGRNIRGVIVHEH